VAEASFIAVLVATVFLLLWRWLGSKRWLVQAVLWLAYAFYEGLMFKRVLCSGDCNIRVDLLLLYPLLLGGTLWVAVSEARRAVKRRREMSHDDARH